jgi:hypothetical protein
MKRFVTAALFAAALAAPAFADDQAAANEKCNVKANEQVAASMPPETPADQKQMVSEMVTDMCGCITSKVAELGDDGAAVLHVMATQPDEDWMVQDEAEQKKRAVAILVAEGSSEADALALYDRINPKMKEISAACQQEAQAKLMEKMTPKAQ